MKALKVLAIGVVVGGISLAVGTQAHAEAWTPRTVDQIKADIAKTNGKEYTIVWGDTLSGISQATNITVQKLADMNQIANVDLIYAGNKLVFEGSVVSVENGKGDTVAQTVIQPEDKVDPKKTVGQPVQGKDTTSNKKADNKTDKNAAADSKADTKKADVKSDGSSSENGKQADSTPGENKDGSAETPSQPANNANQNDVAGGSSNQGQTTPDTPANNSSETQTPSTPSNNGGATTSSQQSNTGNQGGSTTSSQTTTSATSNTGTNQGSSTGGNSSTSTSTTQQPTIIGGYIGNSGKIFNTPEEANKFADEKAANDLSIKGYKLITIDYSNGSEKFSIDFY
ncbi:LysM peptidoglycan-binding domain-containing protein [Enterococcus casseliflavus]|uniref:LysM peptidoglycan-binding domain-containing protein n=1 Tax=Enterococcus casseliflavus TaxID=37734 RepID=UPI002DBCF818|nr:LysM peptidoglycan-binding domain-containing protein [Enterococcus casseliflavus]MEB8416423.1 LysM peptidoglycan-binding domain-containing protein [Enterococcus casseliflavus]